MSSVEKEIIYFVDPMCSWCWGFSPTINKIVSNLLDGIGIRTVMGGLRPFTKEVMTKKMKNYILDHWTEVYAQSGQPFDFNFNIGEGFIYDTEPSSRALVTVREINKNIEFEYLNKIQLAFYKDMKDVTNCVVLADIAKELGVNKTIFMKLFNSDELKKMTQKEFNTSERLGIRGFPTLLTRIGKELTVVTQGFQNFESLNENLKGFIKK